jgi:hypothetical protein
MKMLVAIEERCGSLPYVRFSARSALACEGAFFGSWAHTWQIRGQRNSFVSSKSAIRPVLELANFAAFGVITGQGESVCVCG